MRIFIWLFVILMALPLSVNALEFRDENNTQVIVSRLSENFPINQSIIPFSVCSTKENETQINMFFVGNINYTLLPTIIPTISPGNCTNSTLTMDVNNYLAGSHEFKISAVSSIETKELIINLNIIGSTIWRILNENETITNLTDKAFTSTQLEIENTGNAVINLQGTLQNANNIVFVDLTNLDIRPRTTVRRPIYIQTFNVTPGVRQINISFKDNLNTIKVKQFNLTILDNAPPKILNITIDPSEAEVSQTVTVRVNVEDNAKIKSVSLYDDISNESINVPFFSDNFYQIFYTRTEVAGSRYFIVIVEDESGNKAEGEVSFRVRPLKSLKVYNDINVGKVRFFGLRNVTIGETYVTTFLGVKFNNFFNFNQVNSTIDFFVDGKKLNLSETKIFSNHIGPLILTVRQNPVYYYIYRDESGNQFRLYSSEQLPNYTISYDPADYITRYQGEIEIFTEASVENLNPTILFNGEFGMYNVAQPLTMPVPYFDSQNEKIKSSDFKCSGYDTGVYENSSYNCSISYPVDVRPSDFSVIAPASSYGNLISGYEKNLTITASERDIKALQAGIATIGIILFAIGILLHLKVFRYYLKL